MVLSSGSKGILPMLKQSVIFRYFVTYLVCRLHQLDLASFKGLMALSGFSIFMNQEPISKSSLFVELTQSDSSDMTILCSNCINEKNTVCIDLCNCSHRL